jgi:glycosyltransferase involved in cell wall biosynthesis
MAPIEADAVVRMRFGREPQFVMHQRNQKFQRAISQADIADCDLVIGFDTSSDILGDRAADAGKPLILDQTIAHPRSKTRVYEEIRQQFPDWSADLEIRDTTISASEDSEHRKASRIVVASSFTKTTLIDNGVAAEKIVLNPYGVNLERFSAITRTRRNDRPFRFVFAGLVCARKGIPLLRAAWKALNARHAELWLVGPVSSVAAMHLRGDNKLKVFGKVPNSELSQILSQADVFVFPSYFEGFALVLLEAMACHLPIITTTATAGPDILTDGLDGWIIAPGNCELLTEKMQFCVENPAQLAAMGNCARETAERFSWNSYGDRWAKILREYDR